MMQVRAKDIADMLGGQATLGRSVLDAGALISLVDEGLPLAAFESLSRRLGAARWQDASLKSVVQYRSRGSDRLGKSESERTERVARLLAMSINVFGDEAAGRQFMLTPHDRLDGKSPLFMCRTELGGREVEGILNAVAFGLPA